MRDRDRDRDRDRETERDREKDREKQRTGNIYTADYLEGDGTEAERDIEIAR